MKVICAVLPPLVVLAGALGWVPAAAAIPFQNDTEGVYRDQFADEQGLSYRQNVRVGPSLLPGVRVSLGKWNWTQSYTSAADTVSTPFSHPLAKYREYDLMVNTCSTCLSESVGLWRQVYAAGQDFDLHQTSPGRYCCGAMVTPDPSMGTIECPSGTHCARGHECCPDGLCCPFGIGCPNGIKCSGSMLNHWVVRRENVENMGQQLLLTGPRLTGLLPGRDYTVTFMVAYDASPSVNTAEFAMFDVSYGVTKLTSFPVAIGPYGVGGGFWGEGALSPVTLGYTVLDPLPAGSGWEYRITPSLTTSGPTINDPAILAPCGATLACSATLWVDRIIVQSQGHILPRGAAPTMCGDLRVGSPAFKRPADCGVGEAPCGDECITIGMQCGWDAATYYVDSGSYVSHVFDSLSDKTVWDRIEWVIDQNVIRRIPSTPVTIKWRVGNDPDPSQWLGNPNWYTWAVPFTVTCQGESGDNCDRECQGNLPAGPASECDCRGINGKPRDLLTFPCQPPDVSPYVFPAIYPGPMPEDGSYPLFANGDVSEPLRGRYFQYEVDLTSYYANAKHPPEDNDSVPPIPCELHESPTPLLKLLRVFYKPASGSVVSATIRPAKLRRWVSVKWERDVSSGGTVSLDVLDANGVPLFTNVPYPEFNLSGLDIAVYKSIKLRARVDNSGDLTKRPTLRSWEVNWDVFTEPLRTECNSVSFSRMRTCKLIVTLFTVQTGSLTVHDSAGQLVKEFYRGVFVAGQSEWDWDGTNDSGERVAPGVYFVALRAGDNRRVSTVAVME